jgi:hypothetical protein
MTVFRISSVDLLRETRALSVVRSFRAEVLFANFASP